MKRIFSEQARKNMSEARLKSGLSIGLKPPSFLGKHHSEETKRKIRLTKLGNKKGFKIGNKVNLGRENLKTRAENHYRWNPYVPIKLKIRKCFKMSLWRKSVFERDNYICQDCGKRGGTLNADHRKAFSKIWIENKLTTFQEALDCVELWDINNGRTLCVSCHRKTDTWGGNSIN